MNPISVNLPQMLTQPATAGVSIRNAEPVAATPTSNTNVDLSQANRSPAPDTYNRNGTLGDGQVRYIWEQDGIDKLSMRMLSAVQSSSAASRFQGLGAALLEQLSTNGGQRISQSGLAIALGTTGEPALLGLQQARLRQYASDSVTFTLTSASGATVSLGLYSSDNGLAVDADVQGGSLSADELKSLAALADSFQSAVDGLTAEPPTLQLGNLVKLDPSLFTGMKLDASIHTASGSLQTFALNIDDQTRSLSLKSPSGEVKMHFDTQGGALLGSQSQRQAAVANYLEQFDAAQKRGNGDEKMMGLFKDAFRQLNSVDDTGTQSARHDLPSNRMSRLLLSGLADFDASLNQTEQQINPMHREEVDHFDYSVSQSTSLKGGTSNLTVQQDQQATLKAAWHKGLNPLTDLVLSLDSKSQNYRYHEVDDQASSSTRLAFANNRLVEATATQQASKQERVRTYQEAELLSDVTTTSDAEQSRNLLDMLEDLIGQDRQARRMGIASGLEQQLQALQPLWLLQADPAQIRE
ncbi:hypothetical protein F3J44_19255 [Pantoea sp. Tr-811]|uniref:hypothetical protein n=1 Tax=Pantoea sp. Tr-811 TaxID=2608361 RepID=UPI0014242CCC|nr:hypothetical protein [Pantoea sp. Tr-811]NIF28509.1 hypothetical protein [Pantoea sp. Tr-811]